jgi:hypothetical protein
VFHELGPAVVREVDAMAWQPEFDGALEPLHREAYEPKDH